jgi:hypothetical protein
LTGRPSGIAPTHRKITVVPDEDRRSTFNERTLFDDVQATSAGCERAGSQGRGPVTFVILTDQGMRMITIPNAEWAPEGQNVVTVDDLERSGITVTNTSVLAKLEVPLGGAHVLTHSHVGEWPMKGSHMQLYAGHPTHRTYCAYDSPMTNHMTGSISQIIGVGPS